MKFEKSSQYKGHWKRNQNTNQLQSEVNISLGCLRHSFELVDHENNRNHGHEDQPDLQIKYEKDKVLAVVKSNAIVDPGAVVIHVQDAFLTG